jgi:hypothetical protein
MARTFPPLTVPVSSPSFPSLVTTELPPKRASRASRIFVAWADFAGVFREVAWSRENDSDPHLACFHVREYVNRADEDLLGRIAGAEAPFWRHVRDAVLAYREEAA